MTGESFICPRCAAICQHPLEVYFRWCPRCEIVTGAPRPTAEPQPREAWTVIRDNMDDCLLAIRRRQLLPVTALRMLPPYRAVMMAEVALCADVGLEKGTFAQLKDEALAVGGAGTLGSWWEREPK